MKLPVFKAIAMTFAFIAANLIEIIKIVWLPIAAMVALALLVFPAFAPSMNSMATMDPNANPQEAMALMAAALPAALGMMLVTAIFYLLIFTGILRLVVHGEKPKLPFYIGSGADELRVFGTWVLGFLIFMGAYIGISLVSGLVVGVAMSMGPAGALVVFAVVIVMLVALSWLCLRLSLATPAAIGQRTIGIGPSWNVSKGNVWSLLGYWLIWGIMLLIVEIVLIAVMMPGYFEAIGEISSAAAAGDVAGADAATQRMNEAMLSMYDGSPTALARFAGGTIVGTLVVVILVVAGGVAWRLMTDDRPEQHFE